MKVMHINHLYRVYGGGEQYLSDICKALEEDGHTTAVISSRRSDNLHVANRREYFVDDSFGIVTGFRMWNTIKEIVCREDPDIVHLHETIGFISPYIVSKLSKIKPIVQTLHTAFFFALRIQKCSRPVRSVLIGWESAASPSVGPI